MPSDTPTLSPAARERVDSAVHAFDNATIHCVHIALATGWCAETWYEAAAEKDAARAALTATVAALVAEAEARGREAGALAALEDQSADALRACYTELMAEPLSIAPTPTPHAAWCQSRFPMRGAPLPCNCAGYRDEGEGAE